MFVKLFLLGRPGCGKSRTAKYIAKFVKAEGWGIQHFKDYNILAEMFHQDILGVRFRASERDGFDVLDVAVLDEALLVLERNIYEHIVSIEEHVFIIIEFAREDYEKAFKQLSQAFLQGAHFLLINTNSETCKRRIHERITHPVTDDNHFVSDFALDTYYQNQYLPKDDAIKKRFEIIENEDSWQDFTKEIDSVITKILKTP